MPRRSRTGSTPAMSAPSTTTVPDVGSAIRLIIRIDVVLPHPDGPTKTVSVPWGTSRFSRSMATVPSAYTLWTSWKLINFSTLDRMVEAVVMQPVPGSLIRVNARIAGHRSIEVGDPAAGQLGRHRIQHVFELVGFLLRIHQRHNVSSREVMQRIVERDQPVLQNGRRRAEKIARVDLPLLERANGDRTPVVADRHEISRCDVEPVPLSEPAQT